MKTVRYLVYGIFLLVAFRAAEQPVSAYFDCHEIWCSADMHWIECGADYEPVYDCVGLEAYWENECYTSWEGTNFFNWSCGEDPQYGWYRFVCSYQGEPC